MGCARQPHPSADSEKRGRIATCIARNRDVELVEAGVIQRLTLTDPISYKSETHGPREELLELWRKAQAVE